ncbi:MAG: hypothetical protein AAGA09_04695 [Pseudomonadota bacterium]
MTDMEAAGARQMTDRIDPSRAAAGVARWRRAAADALGQDPGATLDAPDRRLLMLRVFGATRRLAELCMAHPAAAATAIIEEPSAVIAEAARDLAGLDCGVGGPDILHGALAPIKNRVDLAIALAEMGDRWSVCDATAARVDFAERLIDAALRWLTRAAVKRGELTVDEDADPMRGVFVLASGDLAHEDLAPYGPLDLIVVYGESAGGGEKQRGADRVFVRIGAELRDAFEGKPGEHQLFALRTPLGSGVGGAGFAESAEQVRASAANPQSGALRTWLATSRVIAGDRSAGGAFLEDIDDTVWSRDANDAAQETPGDRMAARESDPRAIYRDIADHCRIGIGGARPVFRTASAREVFETAAGSQIISEAAARRLIAGGELAHMVVARAQMIKGVAVVEAARDDERTALATLCGYETHEALDASLAGARGDAENTLWRLNSGLQEEVARYRGEGDAENSDVDHLEDLGFRNGAYLSVAVDQWARSAEGADDEITPRFSSHAPGFLTDIGETQHPDNAVRLFDGLLNGANDAEAVFALVREEGRARDALIDGLGCFSDAVAPLTELSDAVDVIENELDLSAAKTGEEWIARFTPPSVTGGVSVDELAAWRRQSIARIAFLAAGRAMPFDAAADALDAVHKRTLTDLFTVVKKTAKGPCAAAADRLALHIFEGDGAATPGAATRIGFIAEDGAGEGGEEFARAYLDALASFGDGVFAANPDVSRRPGGTAGVLAPSLSAYKSFVQAEVVAHDQIMLARCRVIAGEEKIAQAAREALRGAVSGGRRADILFRDLDRARAQRMRRDRPSSEWDLDRIEGGRSDAELVISTLIYRHAASHPFVQTLPVDEALSAMVRSDLIADDAAKTLQFARAFWTRLQVARALGGWSDPVQAPIRQRFGALLARAAGVERVEQVRPLMHGYGDDVSRLYAQLVLGRPPLNLIAEAAG